MGGRLALALASMLLVLAAWELTLRLLPPHPDGFGQTRAAGRWEARYWRPMNSAGFRDQEHAEEALRRSRRLFVLGDSFAAGAGVQDPADRFADRFAARLGPGWSMVLLAKPGWDTGQELAALDGFPVRPDMVVLSYYLNDIEGAAVRGGHSFALDLSVRPSWIAPLVARSDLASLLYWRVRRAQLWRSGRAYADYVYAAFEDPEIWAAHAEQLRELLARTRRDGAVLLVVVFPHLFDLDGSARPVSRVTELFAHEEGVPMVDVLALIRSRGFAPRELFAGAVDPHPSVLLHREVGDALAALPSH